MSIRILAENKVKGAKTVHKLIENPNKMLSAILFGDVIVNITAASTATLLAEDLFQNIGVLIAILLLTLVILIFGEIIPRTIAEANSEKLALRYGSLVLILARILSPFIIMINTVSNGILKLMRIDPSTKSNTITENELRNIVDVSHEEGVIESEERRMITNVVDFGDSLAKDVMVPRIDMAFAHIDLSFDELISLFASDKFSRMPVYNESRDNVVGIINLKDVFFYIGSKEDFKIKDLMREPYFTYEYKRTAELLMELRKKIIPIAIVLDEYGATIGLITLEDLLEEIVGEIRDEYDMDEEDAIKHVRDNEYLAHGNVKLNAINEMFHLSLESEDYDSIAGHIINILNHLPKKGEWVMVDHVTFTVDSIDKNRIDKVRIHVAPIEKPDTEESTEY